MSSVEFIDNSVQVKSAIEAAAIKWLHEAAGEIQAQAMRNTREDTGKTKQSWEYRVDTAEKKAVVGSNAENAIWEEFGTGQYALKGDGRKGGWYVPEEKLTQKAKSRMKKVIGKNGKVFYFTRGKRPTRAFFKAYTMNKSKLKKSFENIMRGL